LLGAHLELTARADSGIADSEIADTGIADSGIADSGQRTADSSALYAAKEGEAAEEAQMLKRMREFLLLPSPAEQPAQHPSRLPQAESALQRRPLDSSRGKGALRKRDTLVMA